MPPYILAEELVGMITYIKVICGLCHHAVVAANGKYAHFRLMQYMIVIFLFLLCFAVYLLTRNTGTRKRPVIHHLSGGVISRQRPCVKETFCDADYPRPLSGDTNQPSTLYINVV